MDNKRLLNKIKVWLETEVKSMSEASQDYSEDAVLCVGRRECAESLLGQIKKWEIN